jgi:L-asparaginase/Glu-tRNA(Gln) amidotransferase subunit D
MEILGKIQYHEQLNSAKQQQTGSIMEDNRKVLCIHTGGTIGMFKN